MAVASNTQVQRFVDESIRPAAEAFRTLLNAAESIIAASGDVVENLSGASTWTDGRTDNPPVLLTRAELTAVFNALKAYRNLCNGTNDNGTPLTDAQKVAQANLLSAGQAGIQRACVRPLSPIA